jgi:hypothetical protein
MERPIIQDNNYIIITKNIGESEEQFLERDNFIIKYLKENKSTLEETINISQIWANIKYKKCTYTKEVHNLLEKYLSTRI